ncbi:MAG TPA: serine/threonine-protein kinase [Polyangiaceae bacterium]|nr:serine/threonine-protein kinase [Polyangiaceae bacterium]
MLEREQRLPKTIIEMPAPPASLSQASSVALSPGAIIGGKYRIDGFLGSGGMGVVLSATHLELDAPVAIKIVRDDFAANEAIVSRLLFEARAVARMQSVHVVRVLDVARLPNGAPYVVMEKLRGADMAALLAERTTIPPAEAVGYLLQACEGLSEAHGLGIVHRDLKPENLFLAHTPEGVVLKILDFGISKNIGGAVREGRRTTLTKGGAAIGSPSYMAPEQIRAEPNLDARADIWSLGTILFELLTGRCPFEADTVALMYQKVLTEDPPSLRDLAPDAPSELSTVIRLCLQKDPEDRFQSVQELVMALRCLSRPIREPRPRLRSGVELIAAPSVPPSVVPSTTPSLPVAVSPSVSPALSPSEPGVSLSVKLGLFATATLLVAASVAFWHLQLRDAPARASFVENRVVDRAPPARERTFEHSSIPPTSGPESPSPAAAAAPSAPADPKVEKPGPPSAKPAAPVRPAPVRDWPASRRPIPFSAGTRYGL